MTFAETALLGFRLVPLQRFALGDRWRTEAMRSYSGPVLYWFTRGQGRITVNGVTRGYGPHNAILLPAGTMHGFDMMGQVSGVALFFPRDSGIDMPVNALHLRLRDSQSQSEMAHQLESVQRELQLGAEAMERALQHHAGLLTVWMERQAGPAALDDGTDQCAADRISAAFTALIERDFRTGHGVSDYAAQLGVTATHLSRCCKITSGRTASALLQDRVHFEARRLLRETRVPIKDVAQSLGFRSAAYFTRAFHLKTGQTPSAFRRAG
ncbi:AraC family transcriptional regulator [Oceaniovalibus sp. ACAM 378]|jgi:AraC-like DNA-binding protein|uniref:helix-turn-helix transcriptional regulator n=1 Tax=Oceaniovalibus sp. ACAM 378 TaxID=2599923 RepID=UPI0011DBA770|nr:AraC family transcriptional regulator [Oceaniovalibus sp. ACAM 378]TYB89698.1 helix-turn-helix transcriptional regulator [Oceaniovalibus sp. ACAM 378]